VMQAHEGGERGVVPVRRCLKHLRVGGSRHLDSNGQVESPTKR
jgi:hypothetical protein